MVEKVFARNMFDVKSYFDLDVVMESEDKKIKIMKSWNGIYKKLKYSEKDKCYEVVREMK